MNTSKKRLTSVRWMIIALIMCLISGIGASFVQTSGGRVEMKDLIWESADGHQLSGYLFVPPNATPATPAPAIVAVEGWYNSKEMQDPFYVELARRGYVVLAMDMLGHGNSESVTQDDLYDGGIGVYDAVIQLSTMKFVDDAKIGITGHSSGGTAANMAIRLDNERDTPLIAANLLQAADWNDDTGEDHSGEFGDRAIGIIADKFDDFYFQWYDDNGDPISVAREFINTPQAKQFLNFNDSPDSFSGTPEAGKFYTRHIDGKTAYRIIYTPTMSHILVPFSTVTVGEAVEFFDTVFDVPNPIPASNQIWLWKTMFNAIGLAGFFIFMGALTLTLVRTSFFATVTLRPDPTPRGKPSGIGALWFWGGLLVSALFSGFSYLWVMSKVYGTATAFFPQTGTLVIGTWAAVCGVFTLLLLIVTYQFYGKKQGFSLHDSGIIVPWTRLWKTIVLAVIVVFTTYLLVFLSEYFFKTDFRFWLLNVKTFGPDKIGIALRYLPLFLIYYVANSIAVNCFNYNKLAKKEWVNTVVVAFSTNIAALVIIALQYGTFYSTGNMFWDGTEADRMGPIWLIAVSVILFSAAIFSRIVYKRTKNPYLAGFINAMLATMITSAATTTVLGGSMVVTTVF